MARYRYSSWSRSQLETVDSRLVHLFYNVLDIHDHKILEGHRDKARQDSLYPKFTKVKYPYSKHNKMPSHAVDVVPWHPVFGGDTARFNDRRNWSELYYFAGIVKGIAHMLNIPIRWGGDWDSDNDFTDQRFDDLFHYELNLNHSRAQMEQLSLFKEV